MWLELDGKAKRTFLDKNDPLSGIEYFKHHSFCQAINKDVKQNKLFKGFLILNDLHEKSND